MVSIGIDIGSTATKVAVVENEVIGEVFQCPTGFSSVDAVERVGEELRTRGFVPHEHVCVATGYGRVAVPFALKTVTEITCHARGAFHLFKQDGTVIDVGGQDTKIIEVKRGRVVDFTMNDKCSAGTGKFLEVMANRLGISQEELSLLAKEGKATNISSLCTVFAESEVVSLIGKGVLRKDIARGVIDSVVTKVCAMVSPNADELYFLTGGLCDNDLVLQRIADKLKKPVVSQPYARYAGAIGAALSAESES